MCSVGEQQSSAGLKKCSSLDLEGWGQPNPATREDIGEEALPWEDQDAFTEQEEMPVGPKWETEIIQLWALDLPQSREGPETPRRGMSIHSDHISFWSLPQDLVSSFT